MITVAFIANAPFISGSERCLQLITELLPDNNIKVLLLLGRNSPLSDWAKKNNIKHFECELDPIRVRKPLTWALTQFKIYLILLREKVNIIHCNQLWVYPAICWPSKILKVKRVCHLRDPLDKSSNWWIPENIDLAIAVSEFIKSEFTDNVHALKFKNVVSIIDPVLEKPRLNFQQRADLKEKAKKTFSIPDSNIVFGFIGQISPVKGLLELIEALIEIKNKKWFLVIAGKDPSLSQEYMQKCRTRILQSGLEDKIIFLGFLDNVEMFYQAIDIVIVPSKEEPLGLIPLEAGMHFKPAIVSNVGGLPETIINHKSGFIINDLRSDLIEKLNLASESDLVALGDNARIHSVTTCNANQYICKLKQFYNDLCAGILR